MKKITMMVFTCGLALAAPLTVMAAEESLPPLNGSPPPQHLDELWGDYDPRKEPLETEVIREWEEDGATFRLVRFTIGTFKGKPAKMAAFYGFPAGAKDKKRPALMHVHGGGQRAFMERVRYATDNGYAGLSINWGGHPREGATEGEPNTDWGALDATQNGHNSHYSSMMPDEKTLDAVKSPRNNNWFLLVLGARRGLTFLEQQPEVDPDRLGVMGHSMGGKITVNVTGIDPRIKAAAPSCGGAGEITGTESKMPGFQKSMDKAWLNRTIGDSPYIRRVTAPMIFLSGANDFAGPLDNMYHNFSKLPRDRVRYAISPHLNHRHLNEFVIGGILWFERHLKGTFTFPQTPLIQVTLDEVPTVTVTPDPAKPVERVDIYYSVDPHILTRFWRDGKAVKQEGRGVWTGTCPDLIEGQPLYVMANVIYTLDHPVILGRERKQYGGPFGITSELVRYSADDLKSAGVDTGSRKLLIDDFARGWHDWYKLNWPHPPLWHAVTRKLKDPLWQGKPGDRLAVDVRSTAANTLVVGIYQNQWNAFGHGGPSGQYLAEAKLEASDEWQTVTFIVDDFLPSQKVKNPNPPAWDRVTEFRIGAQGGTVIRGSEPVDVGNQPWKGERGFRNLRWIRGE